MFASIQFSRSSKLLLCTKGVSFKAFNELMAHRITKQAFVPGGSRLVARYFSASNRGVPNIDPQQESRRKGLWVMTCVSGLIGACLLTAIGAREYQKLKMRARGIEPIKNRLYGRRPTIYKYRGFNLFNFIVNGMDGIHTFEVRDDDVWVVTFPKAGTTWLQEIVYLLQTDLDFETAKKENMDDRFPYLEFIYPGLKTINNKPSPRLIKTHLPFSLLPNQMADKKPKIIYLARNPKDTLVSFYHFSYKFLNANTFEQKSFSGTFEDYCQLFVDDLGVYGPWWKHVKEGWNKRDDDNVLFLTYEDMQMDIRGSITKIASFLGKTLSAKDVEAIATHCSFDKMKNNDKANYNWMKDLDVANKGVNFMRKGKVGDWKNHLSPEIAARIDEMVKTRIEPLGLEFKFSLDD